MPAPPLTSLNRSRLVDCLAEIGAGAAGPVLPTIAEGLAPWLAWTDAIALFDELQRVWPASAMPPAAGRNPRAVVDDVTRIRAELATGVTSDPAFADPGRDASNLRRHAQAQQRLFEQRLMPLRERVRAALAVRSPALARLAALDAVLEKAFGARERELLGNVPGLVERRRDAAAADGRTLQTALLAELELRLLPIDGMVDALQQAAGGDV